MDKIKKETITKEKKQKKNKFRIVIVLIALVIFGLYLFVSFRGAKLEMLEIGANYEDVFMTNIKYNIAIMVVLFLINFISIYITTKLIRKGLKKFFDEEKKVMPKLPIKSISLIISIIVGIIVTPIIFDKIVLFTNSTTFGVSDQIFNMDISYYMFQKPMIELAIIYVIGLILGLTIYTAIYYIFAFNKYFDGIDINTLKKNTFIKQIKTAIVAMAIMLSVLIIFNSQNILFEKFLSIKDTESLNYSIFGAGFIDATIKVWGYRILSIIIVVSVIMALRAFNKQNTKKVLFSLLIIPIYLIILFLIIMIVNLTYVKPNELERERKYIGYNIESTRNAYGINISEEVVENEGIITKDVLEKNSKVIDNVNILTKDIVLKHLEEYYSNTKTYSFDNTSPGIYNIDNKEKLVYISPREISNTQTKTYSGNTYEYTHGFGNILTDASKVDVLGNVVSEQKEFDGTDSKVYVKEPRIYFGRNTTSTIITNSSDKKEFDYPTSSTTNTENIYDGKAGLTLNFADRLILAIKQKNIKLAFASGITNESKILTNREIIGRAKKIMPYLTYDAKPYMIIDGSGNQVWVLDAYTTSTSYPYSQITTIENGTEKIKLNYIRNSVKVLIDAYDGTVKFYITDRNDPIIMAYYKMYPEMFMEEEIKEDVSKHFVYPELLYNVQVEMLQKYHNVKPEVLYRNDDSWDVAKHNNTKTATLKGLPLNPYYTMVKTNYEDAKLGLVIPYTQKDKQNLISYLVGTVDKNGNKNLKVYKYSADSNVFGPMQLDTQLEQDKVISEELNTLSNIAGTKIIKEMIIVPIDNYLLYIEPIYQVALNEKVKVPVLKKVIVASGNKVAIGNNISEAIENLFSKEAAEIEIENTDTVTDLVKAIVKANNNLKSSTDNSNWEMIGQYLQKLQILVDKLEIILKDEEEKNGQASEDIGLEGDELINSILDNQTNSDQLQITKY